MTIRDRVREIQRELRDAEVQPERARVMLTTLTALLGNCLDEIRVAEQEYAVHLLACLDASEKANRARIQAEASPQFARKQIARDTRELVVEMIRSLKYVLRSSEEEMRLTR